MIYDHKLFYYEDDLPPDYPYDEMFSYSWVDIVRLFPGDEFVRGWQARNNTCRALVEALRGVIAEADRETEPFIRARALLGSLEPKT